MGIGIGLYAYVMLTILAYRIAESRGMSGGYSILLSLFFTPIASMFYYAFVNPEWVIARLKAKGTYDEEDTCNEDLKMYLKIFIPPIIIIVILLLSLLL